LPHRLQRLLIQRRSGLAELRLHSLGRRVYDMDISGQPIRPNL
jgi:hypothetical protein